MLNVHGLIILICIMSVLGSANSYGHPQGEGRVSMQGSIIETPCAIDTQSRDQSIDMGTTPVGVIARDGQGAARPFSIQLINCSLPRGMQLPDWQSFQITFDGERRGGFFGVHGSAQGVALELVDANGNIAHPGEPLPTGALADGDLRLNYSLRLVGDRDVLQAGQFTSTLRFRMDYY
ncbi:fimbrial anchor (mannose-resistance fimbriae), MrfB protein [Enterobacter cancerogenus]|uniref:Fimbrial anchor (Mannose-resistance fimbriae), MrfB protein n=1 Tax=Enterobacter cancerogenus TaxID=69218 RepID=A0A484WV70_9ENTR|nr:fimbrial anchor (mannose-resistance fimbriae), MrfB protein [Enterobacter cancerogenus]